MRMYMYCRKKFRSQTSDLWTDAATVRISSWSQAASVNRLEPLALNANLLTNITPDRFDTKSPKPKLCQGFEILSLFQTSVCLNSRANILCFWRKRDRAETSKETKKTKKNKKAQDPPEKNVVLFGFKLYSNVNSRVKRRQLCISNRSNSQFWQR